jgi:hypothetical protein
MRPVTAKISIDRPAEEIWEYLLDVASRPEFAGDMFLDFRLARVESKGLGAAARYRLGKRARDRFAGTTIVEADPFTLIREEGSTGRGGRVPLVFEYLLESSGGGPTKVTLTFATAPLLPIDRLREFGMRRKLQARSRRAMRRLRDILEGAPRVALGERPTIGGIDRFRIHNP